jgi:predicted N-acetyltransferase YhbS
MKMTEISIPHSERHSSLETRRAIAADIPRLVSLINTTYAIETFLEGNRTDENRLATIMQKGSILVAEDASGQLLACVYFEVRPPDLDGDRPRGYLGQLAVDPAHQGSGLARRIVAAAEDRLRLLGCHAVDMIVLSLRPELPPIYRRFGYIETGTQEFSPVRALKPGYECHGIVMSKSL